MTDEQVTIPGNNLPLPEDDLLRNIGKYLALWEHEQKKRLLLVQAYLAVKTERDELEAKLELLEPSA